MLIENSKETALHLLYVLKVFLNSDAEVSGMTAKTLADNVSAQIGAIYEVVSDLRPPSYESIPGDD